MILSRFVRFQLISFVVLTLIGLSLITVKYLRVPEQLGIGRITVTAELPEMGGLYDNANVTYRGATIGRVSSVGLAGTGVQAVLTLPDNIDIPADGLEVNVHSMSAIGEQYIDLVPTTTSGPYLRDGQVLDAGHASLPQAVGPLLDQADALLAGVPAGKLHTLIDEAFTAFDGSAEELARLVATTREFLAEAGDNAATTAALIEDVGPLLNSQVVSSDAIRSWNRDLAGLTGQLEQSDPQLRSILERGAPVAAQVGTVIDEAAPALPILLANLISGGEVASTYQPGVEQLLVLLPPLVAAIQTVVNGNLDEQMAVVDFHMQFGDPPPCTVGYLPADQWRYPTLVDTPPTPNDLYCKIPQDSPIGVRGARNLPCMEYPGRRAPTPAICADPQGYVPMGDMSPWVASGPPNLGATLRAAESESGVITWQQMLMGMTP